MPQPGIEPVTLRLPADALAACYCLPTEQDRIDKKDKTEQIKKKVGLNEFIKIRMRMNERKIV